MEEGSAGLGRRSSSTEVAAIELGAPLARPSAEVRDNSSILIENPLRMRGQESPENALRDERSSSMERNISTFLSSTRNILEEMRKERLDAASASQDPSVKTTFEGTRSAEKSECEQLDEDFWYFHVHSCSNRRFSCFADSRICYENVIMIRMLFSPPHFFHLCF